MMREIADLGFEYIELSHGIRLSLVPGILKALNEGMIRVASLHNFCPLPLGVNTAAPNWYQPSAKRGSECEQWVRQTLRTIEFAGKLGAPYIVMHAGSVPSLKNSLKRELEKRTNGRMIEMLWKDPAYLKLHKDIMKSLRKKAMDSMERVLKSFERVIPAARENGVRLGIENREDLSELPLDAEMADFVANLSAIGPFGYWHDTGHAAIKQRLGIIDAYDHLKKNANHLIGFHLHDTSSEGIDHQPLGTGIIDFQRLRPFLGNGHVLTLELSPKLSRNEVIASRDFLLNLLEGL